MSSRADVTAQTAPHDALVRESGELRVVCALSGQLAGLGCPHHLPQRFWTGHVPDAPCSWHPSDCVGDGSAPRECAGLEALPARYSAWAHDTGRAAPGIPVTRAASERSPTILFPTASARFALDDHLNGEQQALVLSAQAENTAVLVFAVDGREACQAAAPFRCPWRLERGRHELVVRDERGASSRVTFTVE